MWLCELAGSFNSEPGASHSLGSLLLFGTHRHSKIARGASTDWRSDRISGLAACTKFLECQCGGAVTHVEIGCGVVPGSQNQVVLDALLVPVDWWANRI